MLNDALLIKGIKEGNIKIFEEVFRLYYTPLMLYSLGITGKREVAEEVIQEIFYKLWRDREEMRILYSVKNYLYKAVRNESLQYNAHVVVRERYKEQLVSGGKEKPIATPQEEMEYKELENIINRTVRNLPERRRKIFEMHRKEGLKYKEIAVKLSLSVKTIEAEMTKAYKTLRKEIEKLTYI